MIQYNTIIKAKRNLVEHWGDAGKRVIEECAKATPYNNTFGKFLDEGIIYGGSGIGAILVGIRQLYPDVWDAMPDDMGDFVFADICFTLTLLGVDCAADD